LVPKRYIPDAKLGTWVHTQRLSRKAASKALGKDDVVSDSLTDDESSSLNEARQRRLANLGFVWCLNEAEKSPETTRITRKSYDDQWDAMFECMRAFKVKHGHCLVPKRYKDDPKLGTWVDTQRTAHKKLMKRRETLQGDPEILDANADPSKGQIHRFTDERIRRLESLGFVWSIRDDWQKHYHELKEYKREHHHCNVPARYSKNKRLGIWVSAQRQNFKLLHSDPSTCRSIPLTQQRIDMLNELGFTWAVRNRESPRESWNVRFMELQEYKLIHGNCSVPPDFEQNDLAKWVAEQRQQYQVYLKTKKESKPLPITTAMTDVQVQLLTDIGFEFAQTEDEDLSFELDDNTQDIAIEAMRAAREITDEYDRKQAGGDGTGYRLDHDCVLR
jgi:Helicase associated domain